MCEWQSGLNENRHGAVCRLSRTKLGSFCFGFCHAKWVREIGPGLWCQMGFSFPVLFKLHVYVHGITILIVYLTWSIGSRYVTMGVLSCLWILVSQKELSNMCMNCFEKMLCVTRVCRVQKRVRHNNIFWSSRFKTNVGGTLVNYERRGLKLLSSIKLYYKS